MWEGILARLGRSIMEFQVTAILFFGVGLYVSRQIFPDLNKKNKHVRC